MSDLQVPLRLPPPGSRNRRAALYEQLRTAILTGRLPAGTRLPASRGLACQLSLSRSSVVAVYDQLLGEGYLEARTGSGTFVSPALQSPPPSKRAPARRPPLSPSARALARTAGPAAVDPAEIDLRPGRTDVSQFPLVTWRRLYSRALRRLANDQLDYQHPAGLPELRRAICGHVAAVRGLACSPEEIVVTNGAQQAFDLLARALVDPRRTRVVVEDPGYPGARGAFALAGAILRPVPVDDCGICVDAVPEDAAVILVTPSHQFPTGVCLSHERRHALIRLAERSGAVIIEDDYDSEFRFGTRPLDALRVIAPTSRVVYVGTFSKSLFPALRCGFIVAPEWLRPTLVSLRRASDWHGEVTTAATLAAFIGEGHLSRHIGRMQRAYSARRQALLDALEEHAGTWLRPLAQQAGVHLSAHLLPTLEAEPLARSARRSGVALDWLGRFALTQPSQDGFVFGYGLCTPEQIRAAIGRLAAHVT